jgi:hypothetical protein
MKSPKENKPSLSDLFDSKKLDIPQDDFWNGFQDQVRSKTLSSLVKGESKTRIYKYLVISSPLILIFCFSLWILTFPNELNNRNASNTIHTSSTPVTGMSADSLEHEKPKIESSLTTVASTSFDTILDTEVEAFTEQNFFASSLQSSFQYRIMNSDTDFSDDSVVPFTF